MSMWWSHIPNLNLEVKPVLPVLCGRENDEDDENENKSGNGGAGTGEQKPEGGKPEGASEDGGESQGDPQKKIAAQEEIIARLAQQRQDADVELEELRKFKKASEDSKLSDQEKSTKRIAELEESVGAKDKTLQKLVINNAFLSANSVAWHDPETALSLLDTSGFEIVVDDNGIPSVKDKKAFAAAIAKLAEDKPYLVKAKEDSEDDKGGPKNWNGKTGDGPKKRQTEETAERERLKNKYPALRGR